jgi:hypothetical protein
MEIKGRIIQIMPMASGEGKNGTWRKQEYILEIPNGSFAPKKVCFSAWSDKIDQFAIKENEELTVSIDIESREYMNKWYTDVRAWKITREQNEQQATPTYQNNPQNEPTPIEPTTTMEVDDDLPF